MTKSFLGFEIEGSIYRPSHMSKEQYSEERVASLIESVRQFPEVLAIGWTQYTPYFNDGEPCYFRVNDVYFSLVGLTEDEHDEDYGWETDDLDENNRYWVSESYSEGYRRLVGDSTKEWLDGTWPNRNWKYKVALEDQSHPQLFLALSKLASAFDGGHVDTVCLDKFGDHANVIIDFQNNKIVVEEYEHD